MRERLKELVKLIYRWKIRTMFYFGLGYSEVSGTISMVKDLVILIGFAVIILHIHLGLIASILICIGSFLGFMLVGIILKKSGMSDYTAKLGNSVNPELKLINKIAEKLDIKI